MAPSLDLVIHSFNEGYTLGSTCMNIGVGVGVGVGGGVGAVRCGDMTIFEKVGYECGGICLLINY